MAQKQQAGRWTNTNNFRERCSRLTRTRKGNARKCEVKVWDSLNTPFSVLPHKMLMDGWKRATLKWHAVTLFKENSLTTATSKHDTFVNDNKTSPASPECPPPPPLPPSPTSLHSGTAVWSIKAEAIKYRRERCPSALGRGLLGKSMLVWRCNLVQGCC